MVGSKSEREEAILQVMGEFGLGENGTITMSFWDLAYNLDNWWYAKLFVSEKYKDKQYTDPSRDWAVPDYNIHFFLRMLNWTVKRMRGGEVIKQNYNTFYRIKTK